MSFQEAKYGSSNKKDKDCDERYPRKKDDCCNSNISPWGAYLIWFIILIVLIWILRAFNIRWFSAIVFSLIVSCIVLSALYPFKTKNGKYEYCSSDALFGVISVFSIILVIIWFIWKVFTDRDCTEGKLTMDASADTGDVSYDYNVTSSGPNGNTVTSGSGSVHKTPAVSTSSVTSTSVSNMSKPSGPF